MIMITNTLCGLFLDNKRYSAFRSIEMVSGVHSRNDYQVGLGLFDHGFELVEHRAIDSHVLLGIFEPARIDVA